MMKCKIRFFKVKDDEIKKIKSRVVKVEHPMDAERAAWDKRPPETSFHTIEFKR